MPTWRSRAPAFSASIRRRRQLYQSLAGYPQALIGNAPGNFVYNAPWMVGSAGITLGEKTGWFSALRWRYISSRPLTEDGVFQSPPFNTINGEVGYHFDNGWRIQLDALNLLNSSSDNATYAYGALITRDSMFAMCFPAHGAPTAPAAVCQNGVMDYVDASDGADRGSADARGADRYDRRSGDGDRIHPFAPGLPGADCRTTIGPAFMSAPTSMDVWSRVNASTVNMVSGARIAPLTVNPSEWRGGIQFGFDYMLPSRVVVGVGRHDLRRQRRSTSRTPPASRESEQLSSTPNPSAAGSDTRSRICCFTGPADWRGRTTNPFAPN